MNGRDSAGRFVGVAVAIEILQPDGGSYQTTVYWRAYTAGLVSLVPRSTVPVLIDNTNRTIAYPAEPGIAYHWRLARARLRA